MNNNSLTNFKYDDIIDRERPVPSHPRMELKDRAKIFLPFAALRGYDDAVERMQIEHEELVRNEVELIEFEE